MANVSLSQSSPRRNQFPVILSPATTRGRQRPYSWLHIESVGVKNLQKNTFSSLKKKQKASLYRDNLIHWLKPPRRPCSEVRVLWVGKISSCFILEAEETKGRGSWRTSLCPRRSQVKHHFRKSVHRSHVATVVERKTLSSLTQPRLRFRERGVSLERNVKCFVWYVYAKDKAGTKSTSSPAFDTFSV